MAGFATSSPPSPPSPLSGGGDPCGGWSGAVHSASWAAYLSDRVRTAAAAQLLLVQALDNGVVPVAERAGGVWNLLSGAVQALVVRDLLDKKLHGEAAAGAPPPLDGHVH